MTPIEQRLFKPASPAPTGKQWESLDPNIVRLRGGQEWVSQPSSFAIGDEICFRCDADVRFYAGVYTETEYASIRTKHRVIFPFPRGTDQTSYERVVHILAPSLFRLVLRIGAFAPAGDITVAIWKAVDVPAPAPPPTGSLTEDKNAEAAREKRGRRYFAGILAGVLTVGAWLLWYDFFVIGLSNSQGFFSALNAEGSAVLAVAVVIGGLYGAYREFVFSNRK